MDGLRPQLHMNLQSNAIAHKGILPIIAQQINEIERKGYTFRRVTLSNL
jgi:hypothetical protein